MFLSVDPVEFYKIYNSNKFQQRENIYEYVKKTAIEASIVADIWEKVVIELNSKNQVSDGLIEEIKIEIGAKYLFCNNRPYTRLTHFYDLTSRAIGDKVDNDWLNSIIESLGAVIRDRKITKNKFNDIITNRLDNKVETQNKINNLIPIVENLRNSAEYLNVLAENIKMEKLK